MNRAVYEVEGLKRARLVRARLLQWRLASRRRPPARWFRPGAAAAAPDAAVTAPAAAPPVASVPLSLVASAYLENDYQPAHR